MTELTTNLTNRGSNNPGFGLTALLIGLILVAIAPTLGWLEFSSGSEDLNVATVQEMHRTGELVLPTLNGEPRINKPPLTAWITTACVSRETMSEIDSPDPAKRQAGFEQLEWEVRIPALLISGLILLATFQIGKELEDARFGFLSATIAASSIMWLRFGRSHTTDIHLALWVTVANLLLIRWLLRHGSDWINLGLAGAALGLAILSKGPVALVQSVLPIAVVPFFLHKSPYGPRKKLPMLLGVLAMLAIAFPWPMMVLRADPGVLSQWKREIFRSGATDLPRDSTFSYVSIFAQVLPWTGLFVTGIAIGFTKQRNKGLVIALALLAVPIVIMSIAKDKNERYLLPMLAPAAVVTAYAAREILKPWPGLNRAERSLLISHYCTLSVIAIGLPAIGTNPKWLHTTAGAAWYSPGAAAMYAGAILMPILIGIALHRSRPTTLALATVAAMLVFQTVFLIGYRNSGDGLAEMKPVAESILAIRPAAPVLFFEPRAARKTVPMDLLVYLNRTVPTIQSPGDNAGPMILVGYQRPNEPFMQPPGRWQLIFSETWERRTWHVWTGGEIPAD